MRAELDALKHGGKVQYPFKDSAFSIQDAQRIIRENSVDSIHTRNLLMNQNQAAFRSSQGSVEQLMFTGTL